MPSLPASGERVAPRAAEADLEGAHYDNSGQLLCRAAQFLPDVAILDMSHQHLRGKGMTEFGGLAQRLGGLGAVDRLLSFRVSAIPGAVMRVDLVIRFGAALCGGLTPKPDRLGLLLIRHPPPGLHLEVQIVGMRGEGHVAALPP